LLSCARTISDVAEEEEEQQQQDPSSAKSMTDSSRQAGRKKKFLRNCAKIRAEESQARMFFTAGRKKSEDFFQGRGPNKSCSAAFYFCFSITVAESSDRVNNRESLCISNVHAADWGHVHK
jgi:hypothetical protein